MHQVSFDTRFHKQPDALFYEEPRLVTHVDLKFALRLQELYGKRLLPGSAVCVYTHTNTHTNTHKRTNAHTHTGLPCSTSEPLASPICPMGYVCVYACMRVYIHVCVCACICVYM